MASICVGQAQAPVGRPVQVAFTPDLNYGTGNKCHFVHHSPQSTRPSNVSGVSGTSTCPATAAPHATATKAWEYAPENNPIHQDLNFVIIKKQCGNALFYATAPPFPRPAQPESGTAPQHTSIQLYSIILSIEGLPVKHNSWSASSHRLPKSHYRVPTKHPHVVR